MISDELRKSLDKIIERNENIFNELKEIKIQYRNIEEITSHTHFVINEILKSESPHKLITELEHAKNDHNKLIYGLNVLDRKRKKLQKYLDKTHREWARLLKNGEKEWSI